MSHIRVLICQVDEPASDQMTELAAFDLPAPDIATLQPITALDDLETLTHETGHMILRRIPQAQWDIIDAALVAQHRQDALPQSVIADGHEPVTVASRFTQRVPALQLSRQVCQHTGLQPMLSQVTLFCLCTTASSSRVASRSGPAYCLRNSLSPPSLACSGGKPTRPRCLGRRPCAA
jgi:hypothetical protein